MICADCYAYDNYRNFGSEQGMSCFFFNCISQESKQHGYYLRNSEQCFVFACYSNSEYDTAFVIICDSNDAYDNFRCADNVFASCVAKYPKYGVKLVNQSSTIQFLRNIVKDCYFNAEQTNTINASGSQENTALWNNFSNINKNSISATIATNKGNSWNT